MKKIFTLEEVQETGVFSHYSEEGLVEVFIRQKRGSIYNLMANSLIPIKEKLLFLVCGCNLTRLDRLNFAVRCASLLFKDHDIYSQYYTDAINVIKKSMIDGEDKTRTKEYSKIESLITSPLICPSIPSVIRGCLDVTNNELDPHHDYLFECSIDSCIIMDKDHVGIYSPEYHDPSYNSVFIKKILLPFIKNN